MQSSWYTNNNKNYYFEYLFNLIFTQVQPPFQIKMIQFYLIFKPHLVYENPYQIIKNKLFLQFV